MRKSVNISEYFPKYIFWDVDPRKLDVIRDKDYIIPRALFSTTPSTFQDDISKLETIYSNEDIIEELKSTKERISNQVCEMVANRYHIDKFSRFRRRG